MYYGIGGNLHAFVNSGYIKNCAESPYEKFYGNHSTTMTCSQNYVVGNNYYCTRWNSNLYLLSNVERDKTIMIKRSDENCSQDNSSKDTCI